VANIAPSLKLETQPIRRRWRSHGVEDMMGVQWRLTTPREKIGRNESVHTEFYTWKVFTQTLAYNAKGPSSTRFFLVHFL
jgi:hypothetical protein